MLKRSVVFISHDFDEAIRIAIMKDGAIGQMGTLEEVLIAPATDYVREFAKASPMAKAVRVSSIMEPDTGAQAGPAVTARTTIADVAPPFLRGTKALRVTDATGAIIGLLRRDAVIRLMLGNRAA